MLLSINQDAIDVIIQGISQMIDDFNNKTTKIYEGIIVSQADNGKWNINYNGKTHAVKPYRSVTPSVNLMVKVIIPQGNQNLAFFI